MMELNLVDCSYDFELVDKIHRNYYIPFEVEDEETGEAIEDEWLESINAEIYVNTDKNIAIICEQIRTEDEEWFDESSEVINCINKNAYNKLIEYINKSKNITVYISQVYGTTSDYIIYPNIYITSYKEFDESISTKKDGISYKYLIFNNNEFEKFF